MASEAAEKWYEKLSSLEKIAPNLKEAFDAGAAHGASAKETELRAPMKCGHPKACWYKPNELSPLAGSLNGEAIPFDGVCLACRQLTERDIKARTEGFELAHELAKCGHARANYRDPNYKSGDAECDSSKCEFCERERALRYEIAALKESLKWFFDGLEDGIFLRDISHDGDSDYMIPSSKLVMKLADIHALLSPAPASTPTAASETSWQLKRCPKCGIRSKSKCKRRRAELSTLREEAEKLVVVWRNSSGVSISRKRAFNYCAGDLDRLLAAHPEPKPSRDLRGAINEAAFEITQTDGESRNLTEILERHIAPILDAERDLCDRLAVSVRDYVFDDGADLFAAQEALAAYDKLMGK